MPSGILLLFSKYTVL